MKKCEIDTAIRRALNMFDEWNKCTGFFKEHSSYHSEMQGIIEDAVHCGIQQALKDFHKIGDYEFENVRYSAQKPLSGSADATPKPLKLNCENGTLLLKAYGSCDLCHQSFGGYATARPAKYLDGMLYHPSCYPMAVEIWLADQKVKNVKGHRN